MENVPTNELQGLFCNLLYYTIKSTSTSDECRESHIAMLQVQL